MTVGDGSKFGLPGDRKVEIYETVVGIKQRNVFRLHIIAAVHFLKTEYRREQCVNFIKSGQLAVRLVFRFKEENPAVGSNIADVFHFQKMKASPAVVGTVSQHYGDANMF